MGRFASSRDAIEFLVAGIADEAQREGVPLPDVERKMLYYSEDGWVPPDIEGTCQRFDQECDQPEFERKIARLVRNARKRARREDKETFDACSDAIRTLSQQDHYLLVMIEQAGAMVRPRWDRLKLWGTAIAIVAGVLCLIVGGSVAEGALGFYLWAMAACVAGACLLLWAILG